MQASGAGSAATKKDFNVSITTRNQLALAGGPPIRDRAFAPWPHFTRDEIEAVTGVLESGKVNYWSGEHGRLFEKEYAESIGTKYAIAVANGTVGLELALYALGIGPGDEVVVTSRSFIASASCVVMRGAIPVFADVDADSQNITAESIARVISPRTKAIVAVHLAGWPCEMDSIAALAHRHGLRIVEDCAQAHGATYKGRSIGSMGAINVFSFCQDKILTTGGEGGLVTTNDEQLWERAWSFKDHGKSFAGVYKREHAPGYRLLHESFGTNWRLTEMQSAMGRVLLRKLPERVARRRENAALLNTTCARIPSLRVTIPQDGMDHAYYKYYVFVRPESLKADWSRDRIMEAINAEGIPCFAGYREMYLEKAFPAEWKPAEPLPVAQELGETGLMFLVHSTLGNADLLDTCRAIEKVMEEATR
jgi:dTDP-4-amino-4,6-dideoxygalactose transaminase